MYLRWDALYFHDIAWKGGYAYEQIHAFFPLLPALVRGGIVVMLTQEPAIELTTSPPPPPPPIVHPYVRTSVRPSVYSHAGKFVFGLLAIVCGGWRNPWGFAATMAGFLTITARANAMGRRAGGATAVPVRGAGAVPFDAHLLPLSALDGVRDLLALDPASRHHLSLLAVSGVCLCEFPSHLHVPSSRHLLLSTSLSPPPLLAHSAPLPNSYTESLFAGLAFRGMRKLAEKQLVQAALCWSLATATRSNGILLVGFFLYDALMESRWMLLQHPKKKKRVWVSRPFVRRGTWPSHQLLIPIVVPFRVGMVEAVVPVRRGDRSLRRVPVVRLSGVLQQQFNKRASTLVSANASSFILLRPRALLV